MARILVVDDEEGIRKILKQVLEYEGHDVRADVLGQFREILVHLHHLVLLGVGRDAVAEGARSCPYVPESAEDIRV